MYKKVLVPLDGSKLAECVLPHVESIVKGCGAGSVVFLRAVPEGSPGSRGSTFFTEREWQQIEASGEAGARDYLERVTRELKWDGVNIRSEVVPGNPGEAIAGYAARNGVDLIVIATHGRSGLSRMTLGSVADRVLRSVSVPVLMVRPGECSPGV